MSDILIGVIVFGLVFGAAIFGMFLGRNLRVLEQKLNASDLLRRGYGVPSKLSDADKFDLQQYITRCYGSLTTFNILFKNKEDQFRTSAMDRPNG
jgi:hypothetical protein